MLIIFNVKIFFFTMWALLTAIMLIRGALTGELAKDVHTVPDIKIWELFSRGSLATQASGLAAIVWIIMMTFAFSGAQNLWTFTPF